MPTTRRLLLVALALAVAGCARAGSLGALPAGAPAAERRDAGSGGPQIYVFAGQPDAASPLVGLVADGGTLYGTTAQGGAKNLGAVYSITTGGVETVMHSFAGGADGINPYAPLVNVKGSLYGTTYQDGKYHGTIFTIEPGGGYHIVYNFGVKANDCLEPDTAMIYVGSQKALYGTAYAGGTDGEGCIFKLSLAGKKPQESVLYNFTGSSKSSTAASAPVYYNDALYVTTPGGGTHGHGAVLKITLAGKESVVYSFKDSPDGAAPQSSLVVIDGVLYGNTELGGIASCGNYAGCGTVFKVTPKGKENIVYKFPNILSKIDAANPTSPMIAIGTTLYGVTANCTGQNCDNGVVYSVSESGAEHILYDFQARPSSPAGYPESPFGGLVLLNGKLYGTTETSAHSGYGTVYAVRK